MTTNYASRPQDVSLGDGFSYLPMGLRGKTFGILWKHPHSEGFCAFPIVWGDHPFKESNVVSVEIPTTEVEYTCKNCGARETMTFTN